MGLHEGFKGREEHLMAFDRLFQHYERKTLWMKWFMEMEIPVDFPEMNAAVKKEQSLND